MATLTNAALQSNRSRSWHFEDVDSLLDAVEYEEPDFSYIEEEDDEDEDGYVGNRLRWQEGHYVVEVPVENVLFMEGNIWNMGHAAALKDLIERGERPTFQLPAARLYRIDADLVATTQRMHAEDDLSYEYSMEEPWADRDAGTFYVQLLDGNHRALAAMAAGEPTIYVTVGPNYRDDVHEDEWVT